MHIQLDTRGQHFTVLLYASMAARRLADVNRDNALSEEEFCIAMKLVVMKRRGFEIPSTLPETLQPKQGSVF